MRFAVIGDSGTGKDGQFAVAHQMQAVCGKNPFEFVLMLGDNIYSDGDEKKFKKKFEAPYEPLLSNGVKFYASLGNHDVRNGRDSQLRYDKFNMGGQCYYSFTKSRGLVEFFALDSTNMDATQLAWLSHKLQASQAHWKVAFFHHPLYSSGKRHGSEMDLRRSLEPLFTQHQVNTVFSGHDHFYERIKPQKGVQYFVQGASGQLRKDGMRKKSDLTAAYNDTRHSFLLVEVTASKMLVEAISEDGTLIDRVTMDTPATAKAATN
ncbi:MAG TPA: metallophosphoesterase [Blastocatellia bacterium]|nr:metallophosphoesterase [Blastocatellia bacterium]